MKWLTVCISLVLTFLAVNSDPVNSNSSVDTSTPTPEPKHAPPIVDSSTTQAPACEAAENCEQCVKTGSCYYCEATKICTSYPFKHIIPNYKNCTLGDVRWGVCWLNFKAMIISVSVIGGVLILSIIICCCCCCRKKKRNRLVQDDAKREREKEERRIRGLERQKERQGRNDEIRRKYGLIKDDHPYQKFDAQNNL